MLSELDIRIDRRAAQPLYLQVADAIRGAIRAGRVGAGTKLPATRSLARDLGLHRNTVVEAYRQLEQQGWLSAGVGAGTFVAPQAGEPEPTSGTQAKPEAARREDEPSAAPFAWRDLLRDSRLLTDDPSRWLSTRSVPLPKHPILLSGAVPDRRLFPLEEFRASVRAVLDDADASLLEYAPPEGEEPLRSWVVRWMRRWGAQQVSAERVFILSGSQQGLDLLARLFLAPEDRVVTEAPTYTGAFMALRHAGAQILTVPMTAAGLDLDALEALVARQPIKFLYTMPCFQNPTGITQSAAVRARLLDIASRQRIAIVEDHYDSDLFYGEVPPRPLIADDRGGQVIYLGTFSKMLFPGLRIGWIVVPPDLADVVCQFRRATDLASATLPQSAMEHFCRAGHLERHLQRVRRIHARRLRAMLAALERHFPADARWTRPDGGMTLWVELPEPIDTLELFHEAARRGVVFSPGAAFYPNGGGRRAMRLTFNRESEGRIRRGIEILGELIAERLCARRMDRGAAEASTPLL